MAIDLLLVNGKTDNRLPRVMGDVRGDAAGPSVVVVGGLHGNQPAGALAGERVAAVLRQRRFPLFGRVVCLSGNRQALAARQPFIRRDLNRGWTRANLARLGALEPRDLGDEDQEQRELWDHIQAIERERRGPLRVIDLHTTSGPSAPFVCFGDTLANRRLARSLPTTAILGLEEVVEGALASYFTDRGHVGISVEAGQHQDPLAIERHVSAIWLLLVAAGCVHAADVPDLQAHRDRLVAASAGHPAVVEVRYRHIVASGDAFEMVPDLASFTPVVKGEVLANDKSGPVRAPMGGLLLMPRYQSLGEDGYFIVREVRPVWLKVSEVLRRAGAPRLLRHLPGIRRDPEYPSLLLVNPRLARSHVADVMHLCGYRRRRSPDRRPVFSSRGREKG
jgi:predicted deacylase